LIATAFDRLADLAVIGLAAVAITILTRRADARVDVRETRAG
jgi:hypothetical protein